MLQELYVENFALIEKLSLSFMPGLNVLTGETGAGKSLLLDAVSLLMGGRAQEQFIRDGHEKCLVEGVFALPFPAEICQLLEENGFELEDETLILSRQYGGGGRNSCRLNGRSIPLTLLRKLGRLLINIHGQMEHMSLLEENKQLQLLDSFGGEALLTQKEAVARSFALLSKWRRKAKAYEEEKQARAQRVDWLKFQIQEISAAHIDIGESKELEKEKNRLLHGERLLTGAAASAAQAEKAWDAAARSLEALKDGADLDEEARRLQSRLENIYYELEDFVREIGDFKEQINMDPHRLEAVENRLAALNSLCKKYGPALEDVLSYAEKAEEELFSLEELSLSGAQAQEEYTKELANYETLAQKLKNLRQNAAEKLGQAITGELRQLYMTEASLRIELEPKEPNAAGTEGALFLIQSNPGEKFQPVNKIASGGELARVVLAIQVILAQMDQIPTLIFDEVDSGLGGRALNAVARKMAFVGQSCQVFCVTHAPLMAAAAGHHVYISKKTVSGRTLIQAQVLKDEERIQELSRMIAGDNISGATLAQAKAMLS